MLCLLGILYILSLLSVSAHNLQYTQATLKRDLVFSLQLNMTAIPPGERISLGGPSSELTSGCYGETSDNILAPMSTYLTDCNTHSDGCWGFFVVRTAYGDDIDDDRIAAAMRRLEDAANNIISCWRRDSEWDNRSEEHTSELQSHS